MPLPTRDLNQTFLAEFLFSTLFGVTDHHIDRQGNLLSVSLQQIILDTYLASVAMPLKQGSWPQAKAKHSLFSN